MNHAFGRISESVHDSVRKGTMIRPNPQTTLIGLQIFNQGQKSFLDPFQLFGILKIAVFPDFKFLPVSIIARIDTDFFEKFTTIDSQLGIEVDICDQGTFDSFLRHPSAHFRNRIQRFAVGDGDADHFTGSTMQSLNFEHHGIKVRGFRSQHRLNADGFSRAHSNLSHHHGPGLSSEIFFIHQMK